MSQGRVERRKEARDIIIPIRRQLWGVLVLALLAAATYKHLVVPTWMAWAGVIFSLIYLLFGDWLYHWSRSSGQRVAAQKSTN